MLVFTLLIYIVTNIIKFHTYVTFFLGNFNGSGLSQSHNDAKPSLVEQSCLLIFHALDLGQEEHSSKIIFGNNFNF